MKLNTIIMKKWFEDNVARFGVIIGIITVIILTISYREYLNWSFKIDPSVISSFGDFLSGFLGATFGMITIFLVHLTFKSQKKQLEKQGELLEKQQQELRLSRATQEKQNFESTFFNLLNQNRNVINEIKSNNQVGILAIDSDIKNISSYIKRNFPNAETNTSQNRESLVKAVNSELFPKNYYNYHTYFSNLLQTSTYISNSSLDDKNKKMYFSFLENSLSFNEKMLFVCFSVEAEHSKRFEQDEDLKIFNNNLKFIKVDISKAVDALRILAPTNFASPIF